MTARSTLDLVDDLGTYQERDVRPIERPRRVETAINYPRRSDVWPADVWAEMEAIRLGRAIVA